MVVVVLLVLVVCAHDGYIVPSPRKNMTRKAVVGGGLRFLEHVAYIYIGHFMTRTATKQKSNKIYGLSTTNQANMYICKIKSIHPSVCLSVDEVQVPTRVRRGNGHRDHKGWSR